MTEDMKIAVVLMPKRGEVNLSVESEKLPRVFFFGRTQFALLGALLLCAALLMAVTAWMADGPPRAAALPADNASPQLAPETASRPHATISGEPSSAVIRSRVLPFDRSQSLKRGDLVVVNQRGVSAVRQVAAAANEGVLLRRGKALQGLYVTGENSYVVLSDRDGKIIRAEEIVATVTPAE
jgi:hypothetical protein